MEYSRWFIMDETSPWVRVAPLVRDLVLIVNAFIEGSFTGSAGTGYGYGQNTLRNVGGFIFVWLCVNTGISLLWNAWLISNSRPFDTTSLLLYAFSVTAVAQYGKFIDLDYVEEGQGREIGFWNTLNNIQTLGNTPQDPVSAEAISWALVEMFVYTLVIIDFVYSMHFVGRIFLPTSSYKNGRAADPMAESLL